MKRRGTLIAAGVGLILVILVVVAVIRPKASAVSKKQHEVVTAQEQQKTLELTLAQLNADATDAPKDRKKLAVLRAQVPPTADLPGLIRLLNRAADQSNVDFVTITPATPTASTAGTVSVIPVQITVIGGFFSIDQYLFQLESLPRISTVTSLTVTQGPDSTSSDLQAVIGTNFFTTDPNAGPGSNPAPGAAVGGAAPSPSPSPSGGP